MLEVVITYRNGKVTMQEVEDYEAVADILDSLFYQRDKVVRLDVLDPKTKGMTITFDKP